MDARTNPLPFAWVTLAARQKLPQSTREGAVKLARTPTGHNPLQHTLPARPTPFRRPF